LPLTHAPPCDVFAPEGCCGCGLARGLCARRRLGIS
jgi:hypothetical protein